jgi:NADH-quinone oxidoreductase subunit C
MPDEAPGAGSPSPADPRSAPVKATQPVKVASAPAGPTDPPPPPEAVVPAFIGSLQSALPGVVQQMSFWVGDWAIIVDAARLPDVARHLRDAPDARFDFLSDVTATDWPPRAKRFDVIYNLYSVTHRHRLRIKVCAGETDPVPSMTAVWPSANWLEREVFDMFGVQFEGHPNLRRILMPDDWQGHPERKDYPLEGPGELLIENPVDWLRVKRAEEIE